VVQIVTLTSTFTDTAEDGETTVSFGDVVDEFLNQHSLADTGTSEETDFATTSVGSEKVDDLDTSLEDLGGSRLIDERRGFGMDGQQLDTLDRTTLIDGLANDVHNTAKSIFADGDLNGSAGIDDFLTTDETLGTVHGDCPDGVLTQVGGDFEDETAAVEVLDFEGIENWGQVFGVELDVDDGADDGLDGSYLGLGLSSIRADALLGRRLFLLSRELVGGRCSRQ